jgi:Dirigent-like protein
MVRALLRFTLVVLAGIAVVGLITARAVAQTGTPMAGVGPATLVLVEHGDHITQIDQGERGPSVGDLIVWGPDPLYDAENVSDTGATTQGTCVTLHVVDECLATETIVFADGSTLQIQGVERAIGSSSRTIVGGSGRYLGATGTVTVAPSADQTLWTKTIAIAAPSGRP